MKQRTSEFGAFPNLETLYLFILSFQENVYFSGRSIMSFSYETPKADPQGTPQSANPHAASQPGPYEAPKPAGYNSQNTAPPVAQNTYAYQAPNTAAVPKQKSKVVAGLLGIFLGSLGVHKFYLGYAQAGIIMLLVTLVGAIVFVGPLVMGLIGLIEGIIYLTKSDQAFYETYVVGNRPWF